MIRTYSLLQHGNDRLAANFRVWEFRSRCGADQVLIAVDLMTLLQRIRDHFGRPVTIISGFRTAEHNASLPNASAVSQHLRGTAADIDVMGIAPIEVCQYAEHMLGNAGGIGLYLGHAHVDVRAIRSRWDMRSGRQVAVSGFPGFQPPAKGPEQPEETEDNMPRFDRIEDMPEWAQPTMRKLVNEKGLIGGSGRTDESGVPIDLNLSEDMVRMFVINDRAGLYDKSIV